MITVAEAHVAELRQLCQRMLGETDTVLTTEEAIAYTKVGSLTAFYRWCRAWKVSRLSNGRYAREHLEAGLRREAERIRLRATRRRPNAPSPAVAA